MTLALIGYSPIVEIQLGPLALSPHGLGTAIGFLAGAALMRPAARARGINDKELNALLLRGIIGALIGARAAYVVNHLGDFESPLEWLQVWGGGASLLGGIAGGVLAALPKLRSFGHGFWSTMDAAAPGLALGIAIGRVGDLVVGDHLGKPTDFFLGYRCSGADTASPCVAELGSGVHQPALYDMVSVSVLLVVLLVLRRRPRPEGWLISVFVAGYGTARFVEDFFRIDVTHGTGLSGSQWVAATAATFAAIHLVRLRRHRTANGGGSERPLGEEDSSGEAEAKPTQR